MTTTKAVACVFYALTFVFFLLAIMNALVLSQGMPSLVIPFVNALVFFLLALGSLAGVLELRKINVK